MKTIALISSGNYHRIWYPVIEELTKHNINVEIYCMNFKAYNYFENVLPGTAKYLYKDVNTFYRNMTRKDEEWLFNSLMVDKNHYKKTSGQYQVRIGSVFAKVINEWLLQSKANCFFFPIIESIQCDIFYSLLVKSGRRSFVHTHLRHLNRSFWSSDKFESLPQGFEDIKPSDQSIYRAQTFIDKFRNDPTGLSYEKQIGSLTAEGVYTEVYEEPIPLLRLIRNAKLSFTWERHNRLYSPITKFKVYIQRILVPLNRAVYGIFEKYYLQPLKVLPDVFAYFPLQFSPESSINTPNPEYIDQIKCVEEILFRTPYYRPLIIKEHPAMFLKRNWSFYNRLKKMPYVFFVSKNYSSIELLSKADCTFTVTGTVSMEAYLLDKMIEMLGSNFLKIPIEQNMNKLDFFSRIYQLSEPFYLYSPPPKNLNDNRYLALFKESNIKAIALSVANLC
jgi:hypothetical protein